METTKIEKASVEIKGYKGKLGLIIDQETPFELIECDLKELLQSKSSSQFFKGSQIVLRPGKRRLSPLEYSQLQRILLEEGTMELCEQEAAASQALPEDPVPDKISFSFKNEKSAFTSPLHTALEKAEDNSLTNGDHLIVHQKKDIHSAEVLPDGFPMEATLTLHQTLRSGKKLETDKSVFLIGDLNAGAEIISANDIWVLGTIRGIVHAGSTGNIAARVFGLRVQPLQIRIAHLISELPLDKKRKAEEEPEIAFIKEGRIVIGPYRKLR